MEREELINRLSNIISALTDKDYPKDVEETQDDIWDLWIELSDG